MSEYQTSPTERLALIGKFTSEDQARKFGVRQTAQRLRFPHEQMKKHPHRFDDSLWEQTLKNVRDGFPAGSTERAVMEDFFAPVFGLPDAKMSKGELAKKHGISASKLSKLFKRFRELNAAEMDRMQRDL